MFVINVPFPPSMPLYLFRFFDKNLTNSVTLPHVCISIVEAAVLVESRLMMKALDMLTLEPLTSLIWCAFIEPSLVLLSPKNPTICGLQSPPRAVPYESYEVELQAQCMPSISSYHIVMVRGIISSLFTLRHLIGPDYLWAISMGTWKMRCMDKHLAWVNVRWFLALFVLIHTSSSTGVKMTTMGPPVLPLSLQCFGSCL